MKEVLILDRGSYWRANSCGYTNSKYEAGLYEEEDAKRIIAGLSERRMSIEDPPPDHRVFLQRRINELEKQLEGLLTSGLPPSS